MAGWLGSFWSGMGKPDFFLLMAAVSALGAAAIWSVRATLRSALGP
jgi:hypothetical protein